MAAGGVDQNRFAKLSRKKIGDCPQTVSVESVENFETRVRESDEHHFTPASDGITAAAVDGCTWRCSIGYFWPGL